MLSLVIPTRNRSDFLQRLLTYYAGQNFKETIFIADSSRTEHVAEVKKVVDAIGPQLNIECHFYKPEIGIAQKIRETLDSVQTDLVVLGADDDFFAIRGLRAASEFLNANLEFSVVHGRAVIFELSPGPVYGNSLRVANYLQREITHSSATERLMDHLHRYSTTWYSVHRTTDLRRNMQAAAELQMEPVTFSELLPSCLSAIQGKVGKVGFLYTIRQVHTAVGGRRGPDVFDWISSGSWPDQFVRFSGRLSEELACRDNIRIEAAQGIVKQAFWSYLAQRLNNKWRGRYARDASYELGTKAKLARSAPWLVDLWQRGRSLLPGENNQLLLAALLRASSPHNLDFMPVYHAIRRNGADAQ